jgi:hypothetical protein
MGTFSGNLRIDFMDGIRWALVRTAPAFQWTGSVFPGVVEPPDRMVTDFGSIPHILAVWLPAAGMGHRGQWGPATVLHDWLYLCQKRPDGSALTRREADAVLKEAMRDHGVGPFRTWLIWFAVRLFGWMWWAWFRKTGPSDPLNAVFPAWKFPLAIWYAITGA